MKALIFMRNDEENRPVRVKILCNKAKRVTAIKRTTYIANEKFKSYFYKEDDKTKFKNALNEEIEFLKEDEMIQKLLRNELEKINSRRTRKKSK